MVKQETFADRIILNPGTKWLWFSVTLVGGSLPIIVSLIAGFDSVGEDFIKTTDVVFLGLTINISNVNLIGAKQEFRGKWGVLCWSFLLIFVLAICQGRIYAKANEDEITIFMKMLTGIFVSLSVFVSIATTTRIKDIEHQH